MRPLFKNLFAACLIMVFSFSGTSAWAGQPHPRVYIERLHHRIVEIRVVTFYASGNVKTEHLLRAGTTYEYKDENFDGRGKGRLAKKTNSDGSYETYKYWGNTNELTDIHYFRADGTAYRVDHFGRSLPESSEIETSVFGGSGHFDMLNQQSAQRQTGSSQNPQAGFTARAATDLIS